ncbi:MAG: hypothetical protein ABUL48_00540 [Pseudorhodoplanes sp.]
MRIRLALFAVVLVFCGFPASAEVQKFMSVSNGKMHPYFRLKFTPPKGWVQDLGATKEYGMPMYVPQGMDFGSAPALIYIQVSYNSDKRSLEKFIEVAHERWANEVKDTKIEKVGVEKRANSLPDFQIYHFRNPSQPQQAYELMAYGEDKDNDGNTFFLMIALSGASQKALDGAEADYRAGLRAH